MNDFIENPEKYLAENTELTKELNRSNIQKREEIEIAIKKICVNTPLALFTECTEECCILNRLTNGSYRKYYENKVVEAVNERCRNKRTLAIAIYGTDNMFQEILLLTKLIKNGYRNINLSIIMNTENYIEYITNKKRNRKESYNVVDMNMFDIDKERKLKNETKTLQLIKALEWIESMGANIRLKLCDNVDEYVTLVKDVENLKNDVVIGIGYDDEPYESNNNFNRLALQVTKIGGIICGMKMNNANKLSDQNISMGIYVYHKIELELKEKKNKELEERMGELEVILERDEIL